MREVEEEEGLLLKRGHQSLQSQVKYPLILKFHGPPSMAVIRGQFAASSFLNTLPKWFKML